MTLRRESSSPSSNVLAQAGLRVESKSTFRPYAGGIEPSVEGDYIRFQNTVITEAGSFQQATTVQKSELG